ncbi:hypothetical protein H4R18_002449 [Coemansia javaensis]|uniref:Uncharacterized protein n=1 Tax=Coemansia javaensis TaxID=2761396 RepID=A0A9W8HGN3_9FUNG|nr:hypothetical protein H4R18_002449 [Coemansia javaensis]
MLLHDLPEDVLICIVKAAAHAYVHGGGRWAGGLVLLSVCRTWRRLAMPLVYGGVYIHHSDDPDIDPGPGPGAAEARLVTNADLVAAAGAVRLVRYVQLSVSCTADPLRGLDRILGALEGMARQWPGARKAALDIHYAEIPSPAEAAPHGAAVQLAARRLSGLLPGVQRLIIEGHPAPAVRALCGHLASAYAAQLRSLDTKLAVELLEGQVLCCLTALAIDFSSSDGAGSAKACLVPRIATGALESLSLAGIPSYDVWLAFRDSQRPDEAVFASLRHLNISYGFGVFGDAEAAVPRDFRLVFPSLTRLTVKSVYRYCPVVANGVFPARLELLDAECSATICKLLGRIKLAAIGRAAVSVICDDTDFSSVFPVVSHTAAVTAAGAAAAKLVVISGRLDVRAVDVAWPAITTLQVLASTSLRAMLTVISRAPMLRELMIHDLTLDGAAAHVGMPPLADHKHSPLPPFDSSITHVVLSYRRYLFPAESAVMVVMYLALRLRSLRRMTAWHVSPEAIADFVDAYKPLYPHLEGIVFDFEDVGHFF